MSREALILAELQKRLAPSTRKGAYPHSINCIEVITCADGFHMSVQASESHYRQPRDNRGPWYKVEVGFPSAKVEEFMPYIDGDENTYPTDTVYGYVPIEMVANIISVHGGLMAGDQA